MASNGASPVGFDADEIAALAFEGAYARLEEAVARLQIGNLPLDDALSVYEEGMALSAQCQRLLERAELRVQVLDRATDENDEDEDPDRVGLGLDEPPF